MLLAQYFLDHSLHLLAKLPHCPACKAVNQCGEPGQLHEQGEVTDAASLPLTVFCASKVIPCNQEGSGSWQNECDHRVHGAEYVLLESVITEFAPLVTVITEFYIISHLWGAGVTTCSTCQAARREVVIQAAGGEATRVWEGYRTALGSTLGACQTEKKQLSLHGSKNVIAKS